MRAAPTSEPQAPESQSRLRGSGSLAQAQASESRLLMLVLLVDLGSEEGASGGEDSELPLAAELSCCFQVSQLSFESVNFENDRWLTVTFKKLSIPPMGSWIMRPSMPFHLFALALVGLSVLPVHCAPTCCVPEPWFDAFPKAAIATPHSSFLPHASIDFIKAEADGLRLRGGGKAKEEPILCRLKKGGANFEVMCVAGMVEKYREGHASRDEVLVSPEIFKVQPLFSGMRDHT